jgi:hypothetical protein
MEREVAVVSLHDLSVEIDLQLVECGRLGNCHITTSSWINDLRAAFAVSSDLQALKARENAPITIEDASEETQYFKLL